MCLTTFNVTYTVLLHCNIITFTTYHYQIRILVRKETCFIYTKKNQTIVVGFNLKSFLSKVYFNSNFCSNFVQRKSFFLYFNCVHEQYMFSIVQVYQLTTTLYFVDIINLHIFLS